MIAFLAFFLHGFFTDETLAGYMPDKTVWRLTEMDGATVQTPITIQFGPRGTVTGQAPCNRYQALQTVPYPWFRLEGLVSTKRACPDLAQESRFFETLQSMTLSEVSGPILLLRTESGAVLAFEATH